MWTYVNHQNDQKKHFFDQRYTDHQPWTSSLVHFFDLTWNWMSVKKASRTLRGHRQQLRKLRRPCCSNCFWLWMDFWFSQPTRWHFAFCSPWQIFTEASGDHRYVQSSWKNMKKTTFSSILHSVRAVHEDTWSIFLVSPVTCRQTDHGCNSNWPHLWSRVKSCMPLASKRDGLKLNFGAV